MVSVDYPSYLITGGTQNEMSISDYTLDKSLNAVLLEFINNTFYILLFCILAFQYLVPHITITVNVYEIKQNQVLHMYIPKLHIRYNSHF